MQIFDLFGSTLIRILVFGFNLIVCNFGSYSFTWNLCKNYFVEFLVATRIVLY